MLRVCRTVYREMMGLWYQSVTYEALVDATGIIFLGKRYWYWYWHWSLCDRPIKAVAPIRAMRAIVSLRLKIRLPRVTYDDIYGGNPFRREQLYWHDGLMEVVEYLCPLPRMVDLTEGGDDGGGGGSSGGGASGGAGAGVVAVKDNHRPRHSSCLQHLEVVLLTEASVSLFGERPDHLRNFLDWIVALPLTRLGPVLDSFRMKLVFGQHISRKYFDETYANTSAPRRLIIRVVQECRDGIAQDVLKPDGKNSLFWGVFFSFF